MTSTPSVDVVEPATPHARGSIPSRRRARSRAVRAARIAGLALTAPAAAVGGQAVMDGVMMRGPRSWAVAVRRHDDSIAVQHRAVISFASRHRWARFPIVRGVVALFESLIIGMRALFVSSEYAIEAVEAKYAEDEPDASITTLEAAATPAAPGRATHVHVPHGEAERHELHEVERASSMAGATAAVGAPIPLPHNEESPQPDPDKLGTGAIILSMVVAIGFSVVLFKVVPVTLVTLLPINRDGWSFVIVEALIKFGIFCVYLTGVGMLPDMRRVFQYHSAEHKAINAWERGVELAPDRVNEMSRIHVRCGTAFIVWLFIIGMLVFRVAQLTFLHGAGRWEIIATRPLLLPLIAGLSFEILRYAGRHADNPVLRGVLAPGLWFQRLTTRECTPAQCEVAIRSLDAVLDHERQRAAAGDVDPVKEREDAYRVLA